MTDLRLQTVRKEYRGAFGYFQIERSRVLFPHSGRRKRGIDLKIVFTWGGGQDRNLAALDILACEQ
jgi:hypothetical protein